MKIVSKRAGRLISIILCSALVMSVTAWFPRSYAAVDPADLNTVKSLCKTAFASPTINYYTDDVFKTDSYFYNTSLASMSYTVCNTTYSADGDDSQARTRHLREYLTDNGFTDFDFNDDFRPDAGSESSAVACAHKKIVADGREYTLLAVLPRSGTTSVEVERVMGLSKNYDDTGDFYAYTEANARIENFVNEYIKKYNISGNIKLWTTGYSGGACIDDLFAARLIRDPESVLGSGVSLRPQDLYCYSFASMRVASLNGDCKDPVYDYIHNVFDGTDVTSSIPTADRFGRYGRDYSFVSLGNKQKMLDLLRIDNIGFYQAFVNLYDPDLFQPQKVDWDRLISEKKLAFTADSESYLPGTQAGYIDSVSRTIAEICAKEGSGDSRKGFYKAFQKPMTHLISYFFSSGLKFDNLDVFMNTFTGSDASVPLIVSMYMSFMIDKSLYDGSFSIDSIDSAIEDSFNRLAAAVENKDGSIKSEYANIGAYTELRNMLFTKDASDPEGRYVLISPVKTERSKLLRLLKRLSAELYASLMRDVLTKAGEKQETIDVLTSEEDSAGVTWLLTGLLFGNAEQSSAIKPLDPDNEQFKQMATLVSYIYGMIMPHLPITMVEWIRSADPNYDDYTAATEAQAAGYRRVYISGAGAADVSGTVTDADGNTVAGFKGDSLISRTDEWIGITTCDSGSWLRLPVDRSYSVKLETGKNTTLSIKAADYSVQEGSELRVVTSDKNLSWTGLSVKQTDKLTLNLPAAEYKDGAYDITSPVYTLQIESTSKTEETAAASSATKQSSSAKKQTVKKVTVKYNKNIPKAANVKAKAGKRYFTVSWKKLSAKQRKKYTATEIQYSLNKKFSSAKTVKVSKNKTSYKASKLKKGKTYYIRVRNIKTTTGIKYVSKWSAVKKVKIK